MIRCRIDVGRDDGLQPRDVVGVIANKSGVSGKSVGAIRIFDDHTFVDLEKNVYRQVIEAIYTVKLKQQQTRIRPMDEVDAPVKKKAKLSLPKKEDGMARSKKRSKNY
jgi:ATP-dependent RNA helicase DeaD